MTLKEYKTPWGMTLKAYHREGTNDENTLISCLIEDEYQIQTLPPSGIAVDLGSHIGAVALALASKNYKVYAVEMLPDNNDAAKQNIEANGYWANIGLVENAITKTSGQEIPAYYVDSSDETGRVHRFIGTILNKRSSGSPFKNGETIMVKTLSLKDFIEKLNVPKIDFMKIDVEGAEWEIIENAPKEVLNKIDRIAVEIESPDGKNTSTAAFLKILGDNFIDISKKMFPKWSAPSKLVHGYFINKRIK